ncbi:MAG TPA: phosphoribosyltransferase [Alphaproteobacteria bacterium]|nr:phosphoribosyltransferase [Alphaproteobacteria bacterium]
MGSSERIFADRSEAGRRLAERLLGYRDAAPVVLALPRGGVPVGFEIARALGAPLDLVLVRKLGAPGQPELAIGAVVDGPRPHTVINTEIRRMLSVSQPYLDEESRRQLEEIARRRTRYLGERSPAPVVGHTAILVDDGIATGATMRVAVQAVRAARPRQVVVAVPVASSKAVEALRAEADAVICLETPEPFYAIGLFYDDFHQVTDGEVVELLQRNAAANGDGGDGGTAGEAGPQA